MRRGLPVRPRGTSPRGLEGVELFLQWLQPSFWFVANDFSVPRYGCVEDGSNNAQTWAGHRHIGLDTTQSTANRRPAVSTSPYELEGDGVDDVMDTGWDPPAAGTVLCVSKFLGGGAPSNDTTMGRYSGTPDARCYFRYNGANLEYGLGDTSAAVIAAYADAYEPMIMTWDGSRVKVYLDDTQEVDAAQAGSPTDTTSINLYMFAANANGSFALFGNIGLRLAAGLNRALTEPQAFEVLRRMKREFT